jgi:hypothetical protein
MVRRASNNAPTNSFRIVEKFDCVMLPAQIRGFTARKKLMSQVLLINHDDGHPHLCT